ncbi:hypothetical protein PybrP1_007566 [[Pythium] brassicae (nom. inval.)]|nr:hypothetical protein PybrP1_007566 [[Pythium] brassicae (nom. inval.)]
MQCSLGSRGECVSQQLANTARSQFPVSQAYFAGRSYCPASDAACRRCAEQWRGKEWNSTRELPSVAENATCVGDGGCLCLAACELPAWEARVLALAQCDRAVKRDTLSPLVGSLSNHSTADNSSSGSPTAAQFLVGGAACLALVVLFALISLWLAKFVRKVDGNALQARRNRYRLPVRVPSGPQLQLEGWTAMRERLVQCAVDAPAGAPSLAPPSLAVSVPASDASVSETNSEVGGRSRLLWIRW